MENRETIITGNHLVLTESLKTYVEQKTAKLIRHEPRIIRVRVELEYDQTRSRQEQFRARGIIEIHGPDLVASESGEEMYRVIELMTGKLDRMLRNRSRHIRAKRARPHAVELSASIPKAEDP